MQRVPQAAFSGFVSPIAASAFRPGHRDSARAALADFCDVESLDRYFAEYDVGFTRYYTSTVYDNAAKTTLRQSFHIFETMTVYPMNYDIDRRCGFVHCLRP
jgi:hypothetical protein